MPIKPPTQWGSDSSCLTPGFFGVSRVLDSGHCPLSALIRIPGGQALPSHPAALLGTAVHKAIEKASRRADIKPEAARSFLESEIEAIDAKNKEAGQGYLVPLRKWVKASRFAMAIRLVKESITENGQRPATSGHNPGPGSNAGAMQHVWPDPAKEAPNLEDGQAGQWAECWTRATHQGITLHGEFDRLLATEDNAVEIIDFKTGIGAEELAPTGDSNEENAASAKVNRYEDQLHLYGWLAYKKWPNRKIKLALLVHDTKHGVDYDPKRATDLLSPFQEALNHAKEKEFEPPTDAPCRQCPVRVACPYYFERAKEAWRGKLPGELPWFYDTWGTVKGVQVDGDWSMVTIEDPCERQIRIEGVYKRHGIDPGSIKTGKGIAFFNLRSTTRQLAEARWPVHFTGRQRDGREQPTLQVYYPYESF